jgi:hypothetical protein
MPVVAVLCGIISTCWSSSRKGNVPHDTGTHSYLSSDFTEQDVYVPVIMRL